MKKQVSRDEKMTVVIEEITRWRDQLYYNIDRSVFNVTSETAFMSFWAHVLALLEANNIADADALVEIHYLTAIHKYTKHITDAGWQEINTIGDMLTPHKVTA